MFRQPKKHAASTSSKGNAEAQTEGVVLCFPVYGVFETCMYQDKMIAVNQGDGNANFIVGLIVDTETIHNTYSIKIDSLGIEGELEDMGTALIDDEYIEKVLQKHQSCTLPTFFDEFISLLQENKGKYVVNYTYTTEYEVQEDTEANAVIIETTLDGKSEIVISASCVFRVNGSEFNDPCCE